MSKFFHRLFYTAAILFNCLQVSAVEEPVYEVDFQVYLWSGLTDHLRSDEQKREVNAGREAARSAMDRGKQVLALPYIPPEIYYAEHSGSDPVLLDISEGRLSKVNAYRGTAPIVLFRIEMDAEGEQVRVPVAKIPIQAKSRRLMVLILPDDDATARKYQVLAVENSLERIPGGEGLLYNLSHGKIACRIGVINAILDPGQNVNVSFGEMDNHVLRVQVATEGDDGTRWEVRHQQRIAVDRSGSFIFFIYPVGNRQYRLLTLRNPE